MTQITVLGSLNYDLVTVSNRLPNAGETIAATSFETHHGGKGANQARAIARLSSPESNVKVRMIGKLGNDAFGKEMLAGMLDEGIQCDTLAVLDHQKTGVAVIFVDESSGENRILVNAGANGQFTLDEPIFSLSDSGTQAPDYLVLQNEIPTDVCYKALEDATARGVKTIYNPSPVPADVNAIPLHNIDYLLVNSTEASLISGVAIHEDTASLNDLKLQASEAATKLLARGVKTAVIVTLGGKGALALEYGNTSPTFVPSVKVDTIVDTTGAGDSFMGGVCTMIAQSRSLTEAVTYASKAGAIAVTRKGAAEGIPYAHEIV
ncbi:Ribokinase-like protein [Nadsonia fulvescens var. elongata DSM 6958]|uniref:Ribokinase n=1 Tax=Nadsonia fulvescens var. elongata DSM 6958 TaxID=857566 RepID=A0A1E3PJG2_9ASCO|nr:Ribokinase-like protein [Nadsonia fulvescens var. elongata DSM 6958]